MQNPSLEAPPRPSGTEHETWALSGWSRTGTRLAAACAAALLATSPARAEGLVEIAASEKLSATDAQDLGRGKPIVRAGTAAGTQGKEHGFVEGFILVRVPLSASWHLLSDPKAGLKYSSCLDKVEELARSSESGFARLKVRETHSAMWMTWRYTVDRVHDPVKGEIRWTLDATAKNDVSELEGSWRLIPVDERNTLAVLRMAGDMGGRLGWLGSWFAKRHVPDGMNDVKRFVEVSALFSTLSWPPWLSSL